MIKYSFCPLTSMLGSWSPWPPRCSRVLANGQGDLRLFSHVFASNANSFDHGITFLSPSSTDSDCIASFFNLARCPWITAFPFFCGIVGLQPVFLPTYISLTFPFLKHQGIFSNAILFLYSGPGTACRIMPNALTLLQPAKEFASNQPLPSHCKLLCLLRVT